MVWIPISVLLQSGRPEGDYRERLFGDREDGKSACDWGAQLYQKAVYPGRDSCDPPQGANRLK